jgi:hypothetical protein
MTLQVSKRLPTQTVSLKEKLKENKQWAKDTIDHLVFYADNFINSRGSDYHRMLSNYQLYNNVLNQKDFENECNPFGIDVGNFKDEIKPYNKTYNKIQVLLGEELKRRMNFRAVITNSEGIKKKEIKRTEMMWEYLTKMIEKEKKRIVDRQKQMNPPPQGAGEQSEEAQAAAQQYENEIQDYVNKVLSPKEIDKYISTEYQEGREILVQKIINYLVKAQDLSEKRNDGFKHALISGAEFIWVGEENNEPVCKLLNPLNVFYHKSPEVKYVQDGEYAGYRTRMTPSDLLTRYADQLTEEEIKRVQGQSAGVHGIFGARGDLINDSMTYYNLDLEYEYSKDFTISNEQGSYGVPRGEDWEVTHVEWMSRAKVGMLTTFDEDGDEVIEMLSEDFKIPEGSTKELVEEDGKLPRAVYSLPGGQKFEWVWVPEVWEGTRIGFDIYVNIRKKAVQHRSIENPLKVRLGYHGVVYNNMNAPSVSIMDRMKPFQYLYFLVVHKLKRLIARDKGKAYEFDTSVIDEKIGLEKTIYYLEEMDIHFFNPLENSDNPGASQRGRVTSTLDRSNMQHISNYIQLLQQLDVEIGDAAGVTKQREGQISGYEAVTNAQQSIMQSSHITEIFFNIHSKLWEKVMNSLVECAQEAWKDSKIVKQYVLDDLSRHILEFSGDEIYNADFGIFVSDSIGDAELIDTLKQMALPILQNQGKITDIVKIYKAMSSSELEREFQAEERERDRKLQQEQEMARQSQKEALQAQKETIERQFQHEIQLEEMKTEREILKAEIDVFKLQTDLDMNNDGVPDPLQIEKLRQDKEFKDKELKFKMQKHKDDIQIKEKQIKAKNKKP